MIDGGLRRLFRDKLPEFDWQPVETGGISSGVPDTNYCREGTEGWIEFKATTTDRVTFRPLQPGWITRRCWHGGRVHIAVRQTATSRRDAGRDTLWMFDGRIVAELATDGISRVAARAVGQWPGGPPSWDWAAVRRILTDLL